MSSRVKPAKHGVSFIVTGLSDVKDTWSQVFLCCVSAEEAYRRIIEGSPGLKGRVGVTKFEHGKVVETYEV